jgi:hypothetical protein
MTRLQNDERNDKCGSVLPCVYVIFRKIFSFVGWHNVEVYGGKKDCSPPCNSKQACHLLLALLVIRHTSLQEESNLNGMKGLLDEK